MTLDPPTFLLVLPDFVMTPVIAVVGVATLLAMVRVALYDALTFEIDFAWLGCGALGMVALILLGGGDLAGALMLAVLMMGAIVLVRAFRPGQLGQGDIWLMGFLGLAAGPDHAFPVLITFGGLSLMTAASYSHIRGKKLFHSMFPAALPGMGAAVFALALRMESRVGDATGINGIDGRMLTALMAGLFFCAAAIAVYFIRTAIHRRNREGTNR